MKIQLIHEWMSNQPKSILNLIDSMAEHLVARGIAHYVDSVSPPSEKEVSKKEIEEPKKNRMIIKKKVITK